MGEPGGNGKSAKPVPRLPRPMNALGAGATLQEFEVGEVIGEGGFGIVYRAFDTLLHREVAIKEFLPVSHAARSNDGRVVPRSEKHREMLEKGLRSFVDEARTLARFKHPALLEVLRFWEENGTAYMAMPYYKGATVGKLVQDGFRIKDEAELFRFLAPLLSGLGQLHQANCFHRDISADNIIVLEGSGRPLLLDFGAARTILVSQSQLSTVILKPGFAPIEQYSDDHDAAPQGAWTDIYALCAVLYLAISGKMPSVSVARIMRDPQPALRTLVSDGFSPTVLEAIDCGLRVHPHERPQSLAVFESMLRGDPRTSTAPASHVRVPAAASSLQDDLVPKAVAFQAVEERQIASGKELAGGHATGVTKGGGTAALPEEAANGGGASALPRASALVLGLVALFVVVVLAAGLMMLPGTPPQGEVRAGEAPGVRNGDLAAIEAISDGELRALDAGGAELSGVETDVMQEMVSELAGRPEDVSSLAAEPLVEGVEAGEGVENALEVAVVDLSRAGEEGVAVTADEVATVGSSGAGARDLSLPLPPDQDTSTQQPAVIDGVLEVLVRPWGSVFLDGRYVGSVPPRVRLSLKPGKYELEIRNETHDPVRIPLDLAAGENRRVQHEFFD